MNIIGKFNTAWAVFREGGWKRLWWECRQYLWMRKYKVRGINLDYVSCQDLGFSDGCHHHSATPGPELEKVLKALNIDAKDSIIDIGCGKGGALITMTSFPFAKVAGLEISQEMANIAKMNLSKLGMNSVVIYCADVRSFIEIDEFNYFYLYNPFDGRIFEQFVKNINQSLERNPRLMTIIYRNPKCHKMLAGGGFEKVKQFDYGPHPWFIYKNNITGCLK